MLPEGVEINCASLLQCPEPWRCESCGELMYNRDANGYPCPGAPMPHFWDIEHTQVCSACYAMVIPLSGKDYWRALHEQDREEHWPA